MPRLNSAKSVENISVIGYHRCDPGLYLQVAKGGTKSWLFRFKSPVTTKQREMGLGPLSLVSLAQARQAAIDCRRLVMQGLDPLSERERTRRVNLLKQTQIITFSEAAAQFITAKAPEWKNPKHRQQWTNTLQTYAYPVLGDLPIDQVDTNLVLKIIEPIWTTKSQTASRVRQRLEVIWDWAKARGYVKGENPARLRGHIDKILAKTSKITQIKHHAALPYKEISKFMTQLKKRNGSGARALEFKIFTAGRTGEVIGAKWNEIDFDQKVWTVPAARMKADKEHRVPLSDRAVDLLNTIKLNRTTEDYIFEGMKLGSGLSNGAMLVLMKKMGFGQYTPHGFRSTFRDWAAEMAHPFQNETVELALAHTIKNQAEAAYRRGDQLDRRRDLMKHWELFIFQFEDS